MTTHRTALFLCSVLGGLCLAETALAQEKPSITVLEPSGPWHLDMGEHKCRLARLFGDEKNETLFIMDQWDPSTSASWAVAGPTVEAFRNGRKTQYDFGSGGDSGEFDLLGSNFGEYGNAVQAYSSFVADEPQDDEGENDEAERDWLADPRGLPALDSEGATQIEWLTVSQRGRTAVRLHLGSLEKPFAAMNLCMENLVEAWGFDLEEQRQVAAPPEVTNKRRVVREVASRYPGSALRDGAQADFHIRMTIDRTGAVEECVLMNQTVAENFDLDNHPCKVFGRYARIEPARDTEGRPVRTYLTNRIAYRMGK